MSVAKYRESDATKVYTADNVDLTADTTLTADQSDQIITNKGATGAIVLTLPSAVVNREYEIMVIAAFDVKLLSGGTDRMYWGIIGTPGTDVYVHSSEKNANIRVRCFEAGKWTVRGQPQGNWAIG